MFTIWGEIGEAGDLQGIALSLLVQIILLLNEVNNCTARMVLVH